MKRLFWLLLAAAVLAPGSAAAQVGYLSVYSDADGIYCNATDLGPAPMFFYIYQYYTSGSTGVRFKVQSSPGFTGMWISDSISSVHVIAGDTQTGIIVCYQSCLASPVYIGSMVYFGFGTSSPCSTMEIVADPAAISGVPEAIDCEGAVHQLSTGSLFFNSDGGCPCYVGEAVAEEEQPVLSEGNFCQPIPVRPSTWGSIKMLYE